MPTQPIPFTGSNKNSDEGIQSQAGWDLFNAIVDEMGNLRRVPGYTSFADLATGFGVTGLHYNEKNDLVIAVSGAQVFIIAEDGTTTDVTGTGIPVIGTTCTFADFADTVYIANGVQIIKCPVDITQTTTFVTDAEAPTDAKFIMNLNSFLLSNSGTAGRMDFADAGTPEVWAGEFFTFEASNDQLQFAGVGEGYDRIHGFGTTSVESWRNDGSTPFIPEGQEYITQGAISPYCPVWIRDTWFFVDQFKNVCRINGRQAQRLPQQNYRGLTAFLQDLYCEDIIAMHVYSNGYHWYVATLPTEQKTFAYNTDLDQWGEWSYWDVNNGEHQQYRPQTSAYATGWQLSLLGDSRSGLVYKMSPKTFTANSDVIRASIKTGFINRGDSVKTKFCNRVAGRVVKKNVDTSDTLGYNLWTGVLDVTGTGWTDLGGGRYQCDGSQTENSRLSDYAVLTVGSETTGSFVVESLSAGTIGMRYGTNIGEFFSTSGFHTEEDVIVTGDQAASIVADTDFVGIIANVNFREQTPYQNNLKVAVRWRDTNLESAWCQEEVDLYTEDGLNYDYFINGLGSYTSRQWEIICTSNIDFQMTPPQEEFDVSYR